MCALRTRALALQQSVYLAITMRSGTYLGGEDGRMQRGWLQSEALARCTGMYPTELACNDACLALTVPSELLWATPLACNAHMQPAHLQPAQHCCGRPPRVELPTLTPRARTPPPACPLYAAPSFVSELCRNKSRMWAGPGRKQKVCGHACVCGGPADAVRQGRGGAADSIHPSSQVQRAIPPSVDAPASPPSGSPFTWGLVRWAPGLLQRGHAEVRRGAPPAPRPTAGPRGGIGPSALALCRPRCV